MDGKCIQIETARQMDCNMLHIKQVQLYRSTKLNLTTGATLHNMKLNREAPPIMWSPGPFKIVCHSPATVTFARSYCMLLLDSGGASSVFGVTSWIHLDVLLSDNCMPTCLSFAAVGIEL